MARSVATVSSVSRSTPPLHTKGAVVRQSVAIVRQRDMFKTLYSEACDKAGSGVQDLSDIVTDSRAHATRFCGGWAHAGVPSPRRAGLSTSSRRVDERVA